MTITFIGHGYVGLVTAAVFADLGNTVHVIGHTPSKIEKLLLFWDSHLNLIQTI